VLGGFPTAARKYIVLLALLITYAGPYLFVYGRTATWTFPRVDAQDIRAIDALEAYIDRNVTVLGIGPRGTGSQTWSEAVYSLRVGLEGRVFNDWIDFPTLLAVSDLRFQGTGIRNGEILFQCDLFEVELFQPTGFEPWPLYQQLLAENDNSSLTATCSGVGSPTVEPAMFPLSISFDWTMSALIRGDRNERLREWAGTHDGTVAQRVAG
jgi:hypothetical protein